jgi:anhydro-N-acetylmuramic acid kinase
MSQYEFFSLGLMSGSSLDGLDICYSKITNLKGSYQYDIIVGETISYPDELLDSLKNSRFLSGLDLGILDIAIGDFYGNCCQQFIQKHNITNLDFIASHGHTVFHFPDQRFTLQIGNGQAIASSSKYKVINNLRLKDVIYHGSGAPIVPIGDLLFFEEFKYCLNMGGIMNISEKISNDSIISYDIGICNQVLNYYAEKLGFPYDAFGKLASSGSFLADLFNQLNALSYYDQKPPKSLDNGYKDRVLKLIEDFISTNKQVRYIDILSTFSHHIAFQISKVTLPEIPILSTGGGTFNSFIIDLLQIKYNRNILVPDSKLINYKESLIMSLMGVLFLNGQNNVLASVTGAKDDTCCGVQYLP